MDYQVIGDLVGEVVKNALPIGIILRLSEYLVSLFLSFAIPKFNRRSWDE